jgi:glutamate-1-semialdehyde 2,1-aminomutase
VIVPWGAELPDIEAAAVICEPYPANMGLVPPPDGYLPQLREYAVATGALLIFDEVITGFRVARGGAQEREGVVPDLSVLGKVLGGGLPAAAYAGRRDLMEQVAPAGDVYQAGTLSGNPLATAAGLATLGLLGEAAYPALDRTTAELASGLERAASEAGVAASVVSRTGLLTLFFAPEPPRDYDDARACDLDAHAAFCRGMLDRGVYLPPSQFEAWFPSLAHTDAHLERTVSAAREVLAEL